MSCNSESRILKKERQGQRAKILVKG